MKKYTFLLTTCIALIAGNVTAQTGKLEIGAQGGLSLVSLRGNHVVDNFSSVVLSFSSALFAQYNFTERIALRLDPGFERKGAIYKGVITDGNGNSLASSRLNYDYLTLPILVRATFGKKYKFFVNAGPYAAYLINVTQYMKGKGIPDTKSDYPSKDFDFGITAGVGATAPLTERFTLSLELRNSLGLADISKGAIIDDGTIKTNATNLLVGVAYSL